MRRSLLWGFPAMVLIIVCFFAINSKRRDDKGERLSKVYCGSCHEYPDPKLLPEKIWAEKVLPEMGLRLGVGDKNTLLTRMSLKLFDQLNELGIYPNHNLISADDWESIVAYYRENALEEVTANVDDHIVTEGMHLFHQFNILGDSGRSAQTTMVRFVPKRKEIWIGSGSKALEKYDLNGIFKSSFYTPSPIVDAIDEKDPIYLGIGNMLPNEDRNGRLFMTNEKGTKGKLLIDSLHRPSQMIKADIDNDGTEDMVILEFGFETGQVRLVNGKTGVTSIVSSQPGARNIHLRDGDKDGLPDLYILFAQAREQVSLFHNLGGSKFREEVLLRFPSIYGSSFLDIADMNNDGHKDLIMSFGDNADYSNSRKRFHGVQIYTGDGQNQYTKSWFYPSYGATKTIAGDFDNDGDQDLAMIGFFSDPSVKGSFLYFENKSGMRFDKADLHVPEEKWLVMESSDMDDDGDLDLILGSFQFGSESSKIKPSKNIKATILRNALR